MNRSNNIGILDPGGKSVNPLTNKPYSDNYKNLAKIWTKLPAYKKADDIIKKIKENQVILTIFETGAGKTVLNPKFALHAYNYDAKIAITLPKRIIAKSAAEFAALTLDVELGEEVGYQFKGSPQNSKSDKTKLLYATDGTIVSRALKDPKLMDFDAVIIDEAHELKIQIDFLFYLLRETLRLRPEFKIIIMSATVDASLFSNYFKEFKFIKIEIPGLRTYPIESIFLEETITNYNQVLDKGYSILENILNDTMNKKGYYDIIFFVTSSNEAFKLCQKINNNPNFKHVFCIEVYANMSIDRQTLAQDKDKYKENTQYLQKLVIATNVAESSLTIDGIKYVIDSGYELKGGFDPIIRARTLDRSKITQAQAKQRMGRAGRTEPGICYHLYTKEEFMDRLSKFPEPEIKTNDITSECLKLLAIDSIQNVPNLVKIFTLFIEPPKEDYIVSSIETLMNLGLVKDNTITQYGKLVNEVPEDNIILANTLIFGKIYNASREIGKINAMINGIKGNMSELYNMPSYDNQDKMNKFKKAKAKFNHKYGDHLTLLRIFTEAQEQRKTNKFADWCYKNFLKMGTLNKIMSEYKKMKERIKQINISSDNLDKYGLKYYEKIKDLDIDSRVLACIIMGSRTNTAILNNDSYLTKLYKGNKIKISKISSSKQHKNVVFYELFVSMGQMSLSIVSQIPNSLISILT